MSTAWMHGLLRADGTAGACEVIKVGGSLLGVPGWPGLIAELVRNRAAARPVVLVVGGGPIVDGMRLIDAAAPQPAALMHALAIDLMGTTARLVAAALALPVVAERGAEDAAVLDVPRWLAATGQGARLPIGWDVTSDSIAAHVAALTGDLLLAKRVPPPCSGVERLEELARTGWVDRHFPAAAADVGRIAWVAPSSVPVPGVGGTALEGRDAGRT